MIGDQPLVNLLPLKKDEDGTIVTQYAMNPVGDLGLLKMDFLGLKTLTVIRNTCELVQKTQRITISVDDLPLDEVNELEIELYKKIEFDKETYEYRAFTRLKQIRYLTRTGQIDGDFFWR